MADQLPDQRFSNLADLRATHSALLRRMRADGATPDLRADLLVMLRRGQLTGTALDDADQRWAAQGILDYWVATLDRAGVPHEPVFLDDFDPLLAPELADETCPYVGLSAFGEHQRDLYFGRRRVLEPLLELVATRRLVAVVGPSGSGKSSLVRAGLIPALKTGLLPASDTWRYLPPLVPGSDPQAALALVLPVDPAPSETVLLMIDQFEETFTLGSDDAALRAFCDRLVALATGSGDHRVVLTMRSDFEQHVTRAEALYALFEQGKLAVPPLTAPELREAIEQPAEHVGLTFEAGVVDALIQDVLGDPAALPLLQFTLLRLWEERERNRVTMAAYERVGGGRLALARAADALYEELIPEDQLTARRIFLYLAQPGVGLEVTSRRVRRADILRIGEDPGRVRRVLAVLVEARLLKETPGPAADDVQLEVAHEALIRNWPTLSEWLELERVRLRQRRRLTTAAEQWRGLGHDPAALLRGVVLADALVYDDLSALEQEFVDASVAEQERAEREREEARQREVAQARALAEEQRQRADEGRVVALRLRRSAQLLAGLAFVAIVAAVIAMLSQAQAEEARLAEQVQREQAQAAGATAQAAADEAQVAEATAQAAANEAQAARDTADTQRRLAETQRLTIPAATLLDSDPELSRLLAIEAGALTLSGKLLDTEGQVDELLRTVVRTPYTTRVLSGQFGAMRQALWSPDGRLILTVSDDLIARVWPAGGGDPVELTGHTALIVEAAWSPDSSSVITASADGSARVWSATTGRELASLVHRRPADFMRSVAWDPQGDVLVTGNNDKTAILWDARTYARRAVLTGHDPQRGFVSRVRFSLDGRCLLTVGDDATARIWDVVTGDLLTTLRGQASNEPLTDAAWSPDGRGVITAGSDRTARIWSGGTAERSGGCPWSEGTLRERFVLQQPSGHEAEVGVVAWSPTGAVVATGAGRPKPAFTPETTIRLWDPVTGQRLAVLEGHRGLINGLSFNDDGSLLLSASEDGTARVWEVPSGRLRTVLRGHTLAVRGAEWSRDGRLVVTASGDGTARIWSVLPPEVAEASLDELVDLASCQVLRPLTDEEVALYNVPHPPSFSLETRVCPPS